MATSPRITRQKISTTVSPETLAHLEKLIKEGEARNLAEAIDLSIQKLLVFENRERLARDTAAYFDNMTLEELEEENQMAAALAGSAKGIDFDREP
jgi:Arc/MetJ-type ribon-helix-helix transcriptional regulator